MLRCSEIINTHLSLCPQFSFLKHTHMGQECEEAKADSVLDWVNPGH